LRFKVSGNLKPETRHRQGPLRAGNEHVPLPRPLHVRPWSHLPVRPLSPTLKYSPRNTKHETRDTRHSTLNPQRPLTAARGQIARGGVGDPQGVNTFDQDSLFAESFSAQSVQHRSILPHQFNTDSFSGGRSDRARRCRGSARSATPSTSSSASPSSLCDRGTVDADFKLTQRSSCQN